MTVAVNPGSSTEQEQSLQREFIGLTRETVDHAFQAPSSIADVSNSAVTDALASLKIISCWTDYQPTPLRELGLAKSLRVASVFYKDEAPRFGLNSFKATGSAFALLGEVARICGLPERPDFAGARTALARQTSKPTVACATDGNHGRAVAWACGLLGINCVVFVPRSVSHARAAAITAHGARVVRVNGNYDRAVAETAREGRRYRWRILSDTAYEGYEGIPRDIMRGYSAIGAEIHLQKPQLSPSHIFVQAGVGGFAASMISYFNAISPHKPPINVIVEPRQAACLLASARAGARCIIGGEFDTTMEGLACGEPSTIAWPQIASLPCHFLGITDRSAAAAMRVLANPLIAQPSICAGESGAAGLAGFLISALQTELRDRLQLKDDSRVLLFGTEGAIDQNAYARVIGRAPYAQEGQEYHV